MQRVFEALSSTDRRRILAYLAHTELSAGDIASRFDMSKPSISQHLAILQSAGLIARDKRGLYVFYALSPDNLIDTFNSFAQEVCPVSRLLTLESKGRARKNASGRSQGAGRTSRV